MTQQLYEEAQAYLPGGVSASVRFNRALGYPMYIARGDGCLIYDLDGREYVDMCVSHGASLLGHNHPKIKAAIRQALDMGIICSYDTVYHVALAKKIAGLVPGAEMVRYAGSGTEAIMHGLRLARAYTGREKILKFEGHFHGYQDYVYFSSAPPLDQAGPPEAPVPYIESAGTPEGMKQYIIIVPFNDLEGFERAVAAHADELAAIIMEPINYDAGCILPLPGFVERVRELATRHGIVLFFDEVLTAFRMAPGGAQEYLGVTPDLAVLGKAIGGGLPLSAITGKREIMAHYKPVGKCQHSGTYMGHLVPVLGALAALEEISAPGFYARLNGIGDRLYGGIEDILRRTRVKARLQHLGARFTIYFGVDEPVTNYRQAARHSVPMMLTFLRACYERGIYFHDYGGNVAHHGFSIAHTGPHIDRALEGIEAAMQAVKQAFPDQVRAR
ncbi:MAG: aspartate aminotransferase family protein [Deltaproteobacteria bacterium]|nr:aspartate aminotransferase family protein [Deltaproteobacteria bacterium]